MSSKQANIMALRAEAEQLVNRLNELNRERFNSIKGQLKSCKTPLEQVELLRSTLQQCELEHQQRQQRDQLAQQLLSVSPTAYADVKDYLTDEDYDTQIEILQEVIANELSNLDMRQQLPEPEPEPLLPAPPQKQQPQYLPPQTSLAPTKHTMDEEALYTPKQRVGMRQLQNIVLDNKRDLRRVRKALDLEGAKKMIADHNAGVKHDKSKWHGHFTDVNGDNIPDYIIHSGGSAPSDENALQCNGEPIIVNGWTTKKSDYPVRRYYYDTVPEEDRKENPLTEWKRNKNVWGIEYMTLDDTKDSNQIGLVKNWNQESGLNDEAHKNWNLKGWNVKRFTADDPPKAANPYYRFCNLFMKFFVDRAAQNLIAVNAIPTVKLVYDPQTGQQTQSWKDKAVAYARVNADLYTDYILREVLKKYERDNRTTIGINLNDYDSYDTILKIKEFLSSPAGKKLKNKKRFKLECQQHVTNIGKAVIEVYGQWTAQNRNNLRHRMLDRAELYFSVVYSKDAQEALARLQAARQIEQQREQNGDNIDN